MLTVGGAMGLVPGAAMGKTPPRPDPVADTGSDAPADAGTDDTASGDTGGGWLTVDRGSGDRQGDDSDISADTEPPALPADSGTGVRVVFDISDQRVWLVGAKNHVERTYLVSGSIHDNLDPGSYEVYSKSRHAVSFDNRETMDFMVRFAHGERAAIGFHDIPVFDDGTLAQTKSELGTPQSAGCIRQWKPDALALWKFTEVGTPVVVTA